MIEGGDFLDSNVSPAGMVDHRTYNAICTLSNNVQYLILGAWDKKRIRSTSALRSTHLCHLPMLNLTLQGAGWLCNFDCDDWVCAGACWAFSVMAGWPYGVRVVVDKKKGWWAGQAWRLALGSLLLFETRIVGVFESEKPGGRDDERNGAVYHWYMELMALDSSTLLRLLMQHNHSIHPSEPARSSEGSFSGHHADESHLSSTVVLASSTILSWSTSCLTHQWDSITYSVASA